MPRRAAHLRSRDDRAGDARVRSTAAAESVGLGPQPAEVRLSARDGPGSVLFSRNSQRRSNFCKPPRRLAAANCLSRRRSAARGAHAVRRPWRSIPGTSSVSHRACGRAAGERRLEAIEWTRSTRGIGKSTRAGPSRRRRRGARGSRRRRSSLSGASFCRPQGKWSPREKVGRRRRDVTRELPGATSAGSLRGAGPGSRARPRSRGG